MEFDQHPYFLCIYLLFLCFVSSKIGSHKPQFENPVIQLIMYVPLDLFTHVSRLPW
jgi:hypothetical protein